jgi:hypothetical protein
MAWRRLFMSRPDGKHRRSNALAQVIARLDGYLPNDASIELQQETLAKAGDGQLLSRADPRRGVASPEDPGQEFIVVLVKAR